MRKPLAIAAALLLIFVACISCTRASARTAAPVSAAEAINTHLTVGDGNVAVHIPVNHSSIGVVVLHSLGNSAEEAVAQGWSKLSDRESFVGIYPDRGNSWNAGLCCGLAQQTNRDDVAWLSSVIDRARADYGLKTIYLVGFSNGGMMAERFAAERPAVSSCLAVWGSAPEMPTAGNWPGTAFLYDGRLDIIVPPQGGHIFIGGRPALIRPALATGLWLRGARLHWIEVPGYGHAPTADWPQRVWKAFQGCPTSDR